MNAPVGLALMGGWMLLGILTLAFIHTAGGFFGFLLFLGSGGAAYLAAVRGGTPFREGPVFIACRWASDNLLFPNQVAITPEEVTRYKKKWVGKDEESIQIRQIASVHIQTGPLWSTVIIESTGGTDPIACRGHRNADAQTIKGLIELHQQALARPASPPPQVAEPPALQVAPGQLRLTLYSAAAAGAPRAPLATYPYSLGARPTGAPSLLTLLLDFLHTGGPNCHVRVEHQTVLTAFAPHRPEASPTPPGPTGARGSPS